jgi:two-component system, NarL family, response regulator NreC
MTAPVSVELERYGRAKKMALRILLADDHVMVRQGLKAMLQQEGFDIVADASNGREAIQRAEEFCPDIAILDYAMPLLNGIDAAREILRVSPRSKVIIVTTYPDDEFVLEALRAGIRGYLLKARPMSELVDAVREVWKGEIYLSPSISRTVVQAYLGLTETKEEVLSTRERAVVQLVAEGKSSKEIASILNISPNTVESHRTRIMQKLDIHDIAGLVRYALKHGLIQM